MSTRIGLLIIGAVMLAFGAYGASRYISEDDQASLDVEQSDVADPEWDYVIPAGTAERIAAGEEVEILPGEIDAKVGESIRIANRDTASHSLGPWYVRPGEVLTQRFASEGTFEGACEVHPSGQLTVTVTA